MGSLDASMRRELGQLIRELRRGQGLSMEALGAQVGISQSALSQFETGKSEPSLGTLWRLGHALNASLFDFFSGHQADSVDVTRPEDRTVVVYPGYRYESVARSTRRKLDLFFLHLDPGQGPVREPVGHAGEECGVVVRGRMDVQIGEDVYHLTEGDAIWFDSGTPHTFVATSDEECVSVWADTLDDHAADRGGDRSSFPTLVSWPGASAEAHAPVDWPAAPASSRTEP